MALGSTQNRKGGRCVKLTTLPPFCAAVMKSWNLNFLEPSGPLQACNGTALPFTFYYTTSVYVCSLRYPRCNSHASYGHLWPALLYSILPRYLINGTIFGRKKVIELKIRISSFSTTFVRNIFRRVRKTANSDH